MAHALPSIAPTVAETFETLPPYTGEIGMKGLPYIINNTGDYFGVSRSTYPMPDWWREPVEPMNFPEKTFSLIPEDYRRGGVV